MFSKTFGYALRAITHIAVHGVNGRKMGLQELAGALGIPQHFLGKILQDLVRHGIIDSVKGPSGGFSANDHTRNFSLIEILRITDGNKVFDTCALGIQNCNSATPCPLHHDFAQCRNNMQAVFTQRNVGDMAVEVEKGAAFLKR